MSVSTIDQSLELTAGKKHTGSLVASRIAFWGAVITIVSLVLLHIVSPEFDPSWRMVSEYALGQFGWLLALFFLAWGISSWALYAATKPWIKSRGGKIGLVLLIVAGVGQIMAAFFDVLHPLHGVAALLGMPTFPVAALLVAASLRRNGAWAAHIKPVRLTAHLTWIAIVVFSISVGIFMSAVSQAGIENNGKPLESLPAGVPAFVGWINRLFIIVYCLFTIVTARKAMIADRSPAEK